MERVSKNSDGCQGLGLGSGGHIHQAMANVSVK